MANILLTSDRVVQLAQERVVTRQISVPFERIVYDDKWCPARLWIGDQYASLTTNVLTLSDTEFVEKTLDPLINRLPKDLPPLARPEQIRGATHGDYTHMSITIQNIKNALHSGESWSRCSATQREALELMATKMGRIVCGDPNFIDHWDDLIGYPTLARDRIPKEPG